MSFVLAGYLDKYRDYGFKSAIWLGFKVQRETTERKTDFIAGREQQSVRPRAIGPLSSEEVHGSPSDNGWCYANIGDIRDYESIVCPCTERTRHARSNNSLRTNRRSVSNVERTKTGMSALANATVSEEITPIISNARGPSS